MLCKTQTALNSFRSGLNCAQSVISAFADDYHIDLSTALQVSCGFGGGMGRLQETCGAVTGAFMVLGVLNCQKYSDNKARKEQSYAMIQRFNEKFKAIYGTANCRELLQADLNTEEGRKFVADNNLHEKVCERCIRDAVELIEDLS